MRNDPCYDDMGLKRSMAYKYNYSVRDSEHSEQRRGSELGKAKTSSLGGAIPYTSHTVSHLPCAMEGDKYSTLAPLFRILSLKVEHCARL